MCGLVDRCLANFFILCVMSSWIAIIFATGLADFGQPDLFESATEPVCHNAVTHIFTALSAGVLTPSAVFNSLCALTALHPFLSNSSSISDLC
jgi:hypothetical protein